MGRFPHDVLPHSKSTWYYVLKFLISKWIHWYMVDSNPRPLELTSSLIRYITSAILSLFQYVFLISITYKKTSISSTGPESTMHDEKMSTPKPLEITHANVASSKVLLVTGYRITMSIVYLITSLDEMSKQSRWNIRKANFYTRSYRWILRHFSVWVSCIIFVTIYIIFI